MTRGDAIGKIDIPQCPYDRGGLQDTVGSTGTHVIRPRRLQLVCPIWRSHEQHAELQEWVASGHSGTAAGITAPYTDSPRHVSPVAATSRVEIGGGALSPDPPDARSMTTRPGYVIDRQRW